MNKELFVLVIIVGLFLVLGGSYLVTSNVSSVNDFSKSIRFVNPENYVSNNFTSLDDLDKNVYSKNLIIEDENRYISPSDPRSLIKDLTGGTTNIFNSVNDFSIFFDQNVVGQKGQMPYLSETGNAFDIGGIVFDDDTNTLNVSNVELDKLILKNDFYGAKNYLYTADYGELVFDTLSEGSGLIFFDPSFYYYIHTYYGWTNLMVDYAYSSDVSNYAYSSGSSDYASSSGNSDTVDLIHASATATPNYLYPLNSSGNMYLTKSLGSLGLVESSTLRSVDLTKIDNNDTAEQTNEVEVLNSLSYQISNPSGYQGSFASQNLGSDFSVGFWITLPDMTNNTSQMILTNGTNGIGYWLYRAGNGVYYMRFNITGGSSDYGLGTKIAGTRFNVVFRKLADGYGEFWRNGVYSSGGTTDAGSLSLSYMCANSGSTNRFTGKLDEVVTFTRYVDNAWITDFYNGGLGRYTPVTDLNVLNIWHMDEGSGATLVDAKSGANVTFGTAPTWEDSSVARDLSNEDVTIWKHAGDLNIVGSHGTIQYGDINSITRILGKEIYMDNNLLLQSSDGNYWNCGISNSGVFSCSK